MGPHIRLDEILEENSSAYFLISSVSKTVLLDPEDSVRNEFLEVLKTAVSPLSLLSGYEKDGFLYLELETEGSLPVQVQICKTPELYSGNPAKVTPFGIDSNLSVYEEFISREIKKLDLLRLDEILCQSPKEYEYISDLTQAALLDTVSMIRDRAIELIRQYFGPISVLSGYEKEGSLYLELELEGNSPKEVMVCPVPETYLGKPPKAWPFGIDSNLDPYRPFLPDIDL